MAWERKWAERAFLKALSCSPSSDSFLPTLLLTPSFPTSPPPLPLGCRCRRWPGSHSTWGSSTVPFPAGELEQVPACTGFDPGFPVCKWRVLRGSSGAHGLAQGTRTGTRVAGHKQAGADWGPRLPDGKQHADDAVLGSGQRHLLPWWLELEGRAREGALWAPEPLGRSALRPTELSACSRPGAGRTDPAHL